MSAGKEWIFNLQFCLIVLVNFFVKLESWFFFCFSLHMQDLSQEVMKSITAGSSRATCDCQQAVITIPTVQLISVLMLTFRGYYPLDLCRFQPTETCFDFELLYFPAGLIYTLCVRSPVPPRDDDILASSHLDDARKKWNFALCMTWSTKYWSLRPCFSKASIWFYQSIDCEMLQSHLSTWRSTVFQVSHKPLATTLLER